jgi:hypothetical protein
MSQWHVKIIRKIVVTKLLLHLQQIGATGHLIITKGLCSILMIYYAAQHIHWWNALRNGQMHSEMVKCTPNLLSRTRMPATVNCDVVPDSGGCLRIRWVVGRQDRMWLYHCWVGSSAGLWRHVFSKVLTNASEEKNLFKARHSLGAVPKYL